MADKTVAILHHHLRGGGVTQIIRQQCALLSEAGWEVIVLSGEEAPEDFPVRAVVVPALGYAPDDNLSDSPDHTATHHDKPSQDAYIPAVPGNPSAAEESYTTTASVREMYRAVTEAASSELGRLPDIWHVHNHALGKNPAVTALIALMARQGLKLFLHIHDFAEDNRPENYRRITNAQIQIEGTSLKDAWYPAGRHIHYAVLNGRDYGNLLAAGFSKEQLHLLANPVDNPGKNEAADKKNRAVKHEKLPENLFLYPVRVIPRKNIGEMVFWAAISETQGQQQSTWAVTLPPKNEHYLKHYNGWKEFCREHSLPVVFEAGAHYSMRYPELIEASACMFTSSIAEGFGMVYLEPWLAGKPLAGRNLPTITKDFSENGVRFPGQYNTLDIPKRWFDLSAFTQKLRNAIEQLLLDYDIDPVKASEHVDEWIHFIMAGDTIDFGVLDDETQRDVIRFILANPSEVSNLTTPLPSAKTAAGAIKTNRDVILTQYAPQAHLRKLESIYTQLLNAPVEHSAFIPGSNVLRQYLHPSGFSLQRIHN
ncbi:MAG: hypothetical protein LAT52_12310 [Balneolales bacterium]|nr:hypothetical protein [Balneolales bacterium]